MPSSEPTMTPPSRRAQVLLVGLLCLVWGSTWWAIRVCLTDHAPLSSAAVRFSLAAVLMAAVAPWLRRRERAPAPPFWLWSLAGGTNFAGSYGLLYVAEQHVSSGIAAVLWGIFPLLMAASGVAFLGERLRAVQVLGFVVSFLGILTVFLGDLGGAGEAASPIGWALFLLLSPIVSAIGTTLVKRFGSGTSSILLNRNGMALGAVLLAIAAFWREDPLSLPWNARVAAATLYLAACGTALSFGIYFWLLRTAPASMLSLITYVTPLLAMLLAAAVGDGALDAFAWAGTALVAGGIALVVRRR
jgi:drug/metabolite transporter (DMT)-like permease